MIDSVAIVEEILPCMTHNLFLLSFGDAADLSAAELRATASPSAILTLRLSNSIDAEIFDRR